MLPYLASGIFIIVGIAALILLVLGVYHLAIASNEIRPEKRWLWSGGRGWSLFPIPKHHFTTEDGAEHQVKGILFFLAFMALIGSMMLVIGFTGPLIR